ncbi:MAG: hydrogenase expression/formation protein HypE [Gemmatimonadaceae bacterium]|jgi:hydrogenase expression/formation protein HypE|nr:hydrogenase expression/formation protein HypE [Gemmatimonadaceae bacterium]
MSTTASPLALSCPAPSADYPHVVLGHGSGGQLTQRLLDRGIFHRFANPFLDQRHDGAVLPLTGRTAFTTDSYVVSPIVFPGGDIGELAVNGTVNDLAMCGASAAYLSLALILEEGLAMDELDRVLDSIARACGRAEVHVVTGDTKVVERGKGDRIFINTAGLGAVHRDAELSPGRIHVGDRILVNAPIAQHGIAIMSLREGLQFETTLTSDTRPLGNVVKQLLDTCGHGVHCLRDATRGGLGSVLTELAQQSGMGMHITQAALPLADEVSGACELLGLDPLYVANEGVFTAFVAPEHADAALEVLRAQPEGAQAAIIGEVVAAHPRQVVLASRVGGHRIVHLLPGEQLPRIC